MPPRTVRYSWSTMRPAILESDAATKIVPLTIDQFHRMIAAAILPEGEPIELIDGLLVRKDRSAVGADPMTVGHAHSLVVTKLQMPDPPAVLLPHGSRPRRQRHTGCSGGYTTEQPKN